MNLLKDITEIVKGDKEHNVEVKVDAYSITVYLEYDSETEIACTIPIKYTTLEGFAFIPHDELVEKFKPNDFGIELYEIKLIQKIIT